jgi:hypothetical protein
VIDLAVKNNISVITSHFVGGQFLISNSPEELNAYGILNASIRIVLSHASGLTPTW